MLVPAVKSASRIFTPSTNVPLVLPASLIRTPSGRGASWQCMRDTVGSVSRSCASCAVPTVIGIGPSGSRSPTSLPATTVSVPERTSISGLCFAA
jgi:hypothetical protein